MIEWRIRNVMTAEVFTVRDTASAAEVAELLARRQITAAPVVDGHDAVVGVVSLSDLNSAGERDTATDAAWPRLDRPWRAKATAMDLMSAPPITIGPDASVAAAGRAMYRRDVGRLLVVDRRGRLLGIVTRTDLLKVHARLDSVIRDEVAQVVLRRTLSVEPGAVQVGVEDGVVTLTGRTERKSTALAAGALAGTVAGVTAVTDRIAYDVDDTTEQRTPRVPAPDPLRGWLATSNRRARPGAASDLAPAAATRHS